MLLYSNGSFIQVLEGKKAVLTNLYEKIKSDPRHKSILKLYEKPVNESMFMGFKKLEKEQLEQLTGHTDIMNDKIELEKLKNNPS